MPALPLQHNWSGPSDELAPALARATARSLGAHEAHTAAADADEGAPVQAARRSIFGSFVLPANTLARAQATALGAHEAHAAAADTDEAAPVPTARGSIFGSFALPNLRGRVNDRLTLPTVPASPR